MQNINFALWLPLFALVLGALTHSLSDDGGASILDHFGISWRFPKWSLPVLVLVCGTGADVLDAVVGGHNWQDALITALTTAVASVFGATTQHALVNKTVPRVLLLPLLFAAALALSTTACSWLQKNEALFPTPAQVACILTEGEANDTDVIAVMTKCGIDKALEQDVQIIIDGGLQAKKARAAGAAK